MIYLSKKSNETGFTLLEFLVMFIFISLLTAWGVPSFQRQIARQTVNRFSQRLEAGLYSLRARQGVMKTSCKMIFDQSTVLTSSAPNNFGAAKDVVELSHLDPIARKQRMNCSSNLTTNNSFRLLNIENTRDSKNIEVASTRTSFEISPPGTSTSGDSLTLLVRSKKHSTFNPPLAVRCIVFSANGLIKTGAWSNSNCK